MANDEEWVQAQIDRAGNTADLAGGKAQSPPLHQWSSLHDLMARLISETEAVKIVTISANSKKGAAKPEARPVSRPIGVMADLLKKKRIANHLSLRARLLPNKYGKGEPKEEPKWDSGATSVRRR